MNQPPLSTLARIGNTPMVRLQTPAGSAELWGKLESANPGGSVKDRIALAMIEQAERDGKLRPGDTLVEPTSGNTGIGLSLVGCIKGYKVVLTMPDSMSAERRRLLGAFGAELILTPGSLGMRGAIEQAEEIARERSAFVPQQFKNPANPRIHEETTGPEIVRDLPTEVDALVDSIGTSGTITSDAFVAAFGTGGTITGVGRALKRHHPEVLIVAVEPKDSAVLSGGEPGPHKIQGIGAGFVPDVLDTAIYQEVLQVSNSDAMQTAHDLARTEGVFVGISAGANVFAARRIAARLGSGKTVVTILCDTGERYLSTGIFD
jgi:cysteine synthase A